MDIYIDQSGETTGPFSLEEINDKLARGELSAGTMAWFQGWNDWIPLSHIPGINLPSVPLRQDLPGGSASGNRLPEIADAVRSTDAPDHGADSRSSSSTSASDDAGVYTDDTDPQHRFYRQLVEAFQRATNHLMQPFNELDAVVRSKKAVSPAKFFRLFLDHAAAFNNDCTMAFATALRQSTQLDAVRGTTVKQLAREIRSEAFEECDAVLAKYHQTVNSLMGGVEAAVEQADNIGAPVGPVGGALLGGLVAGKGSRVAGAAAGGLAALASTIGAMNQRAALYGQASAMIQEAERLAPVQVGQYLDAVAAMPVALVDLLGAKCFGGTVDLQAQQQCARLCSEHVRLQNQRAAESVRSMYRQNEALARAPQEALKLPRVPFHLGCVGAFDVVIGVVGILGICTADVHAVGAFVPLALYGIGHLLYRKWSIDRVNRERGHK